MTKEFCEIKTFGDGMITLYRDLLYANRTPKNKNEYYFNVRSGFMEGDYHISQDELCKLKTFLNKTIEDNK